jgi:phage terminase large subunit GpA-like protein
MPDVKFSERGIIPAGTVVCTFGVDSQADGFFWLLACWGRKMECWLPCTGRLTGDMRSEEIWKALAEVLATGWLDHEGNLYRPAACALDVQGQYYGECLEFIRAYGWRLRLKAIRGYSPAKGLAAGRSFGILRNRFPDRSTGVLVQTVDVDICKTTLMTMLQRKEPGAGFVHIPCNADGSAKGGWDQAATEELEAEYPRKTNVRGYPVSRWYKKAGQPNHRFDCFVYSLVALHLSRFKIDSCEIQRIEARNVEKSSEQKNVHARSPFGARKMFVKSDPEIGGLAGYGVELPPDPRPTGWGALPGSAVSL